MKPDKRQTIILLIAIIVGINSCFDEEQRGIDLAIRNFTQQSYVLTVQIHDQLGSVLYNLSIPIEPADENIPFDYYHEFNCDFERFVVKTTLEQVPTSQVIDEQIGFWPGEAGSANGAASKRILVQIGVIDQEGQIKAKFMGIL